MIAAAVFLGTAIFMLGLALAEFGKCLPSPSCTGVADVLQGALSSANIGVTILLAATIAGVFGASIPWVGVAVVAALIIGGLACSISLGLVAGNIDSFAKCIRGISGGRLALPANIAAGTAATIASVATGIFVALIFFSVKSIPSCTPEGNTPCI